MSKILLGLFLGFLIGTACHCFDIPLPSPPKLIGVLVVLSITLGYIGADSLLARRAETTRNAAQPAAAARYCGGPTGLPPSREGHTVLLSTLLPQNAQTAGKSRAK